MRKKRFNFSLIFMIFLSLISQVVTLSKSSIVAGQFGLSSEMDAFNFSNSIVTFLFGLVAGGMPTIVLPQYVKKDNQKNINGFLTIVYLFLLIMIFIILFLRYQIVGLLSNRDDVFIGISCNILVLLFFSQYFLSITNVTAAFYQSRDLFNIPKLISLLSQFVVVGLLIFYHNLNIYQYTIILVIGVLFNFLVDICVAIKCGWSYIPNFNFKSPEVRSLLLLFFPIILSTSVYNISLFCDSAIASRFSTGKLTILSYSNQISGMINSVLIGNLVVYAYPKIIRHIEENGDQGDFWNIVILFHSIVCLIIVGFIGIGREGISLLFEHGQFTSEAVSGVFLGTTLYIIGMQSNVVRDLLYRYFYANGNTSGPAKNSIFVSVSNILISLLLVYLIGFYGVILGTVVASLISLGLIFSKFIANYGIGDNFQKVLYGLFINIVVALLTFVLFILFRQFFNFNSLIVRILGYGLFITFTYLLFIFVFNKDVFRTLKSF